MVWYSHLLKNFPQFVVIHRVKGFKVVNKAEVDIFLELSLFYGLTDADIFQYSCLLVCSARTGSMLKVQRVWSHSCCSIRSGPSCLCPLPFLMLSSNQRFKTGKGGCQGCVLSPCLFNLYAEYIMQNAVLEEAQAGIKIAGRNINNLRYADGITLMAESEEELKSLLMKVKEESEKASLKLNIQKMKVMASVPITSWQIDGETVADFIFMGSKITADGDRSHEIKRHLLIGRKVKTNLDSILKSRDITLPTKVRLVKAVVFPVVMYGCESWTVKKAEH